MLMSSSTSGETNTDANEVCRRAFGIERRLAHQAVHAGLGAQPAVGILAREADRALLMPATSPSLRSMTSVLKPCASPQRRYMRISICAQSCASVPPAPAWMSRNALCASISPGNMRGNSSCLTSCSTLRRCRRSTSSAVDSSSSATAISSSSRASREGCANAVERGAPPARAWLVRGRVPEPCPGYSRCRIFEFAADFRQAFAALCRIQRNLRSASLRSARSSSSGGCD